MHIWGKENLYLYLLGHCEVILGESFAVYSIICNIKIKRIVIQELSTKGNNKQHGGKEERDHTKLKKNQTVKRKTIFILRERQIEA